MQHTLNYEILSEELFTNPDFEDTYQFEIEINDNRFMNTHKFTIAFQKNKNGVWCSASQFDYDADDSQLLIRLGEEMAQSFADPEIIEYYQLSNTGLEGDEFVVTNLLDLELEKYIEIETVLNLGFDIIADLAERIEN